MVLLGALLIVYGMLSLFARDFVWKLAHVAYEICGLPVERSETWEASTTVSGMIALVVGLVVVLSATGSARPGVLPSLL